MFKLIIAGTRNFSDYQLLCERLDFFTSSKNAIEVVSGTARGADVLGEKWASERGVGVKRFPADWEKYGKRAGYIRNAQMADYADALIAFWDGESRGTKNMIDEMTKRGKPFRVVRYNINPA